MGGEGFALPAGTCSLMKPTIFFAMNGSYTEYKRRAGTIPLQLLVR
jgi:hypothetical protein